MFTKSTYFAIILFLLTVLLSGCKTYTSLDVPIPKDKIYPKLDPIKPDLSGAQRLSVGGRIAFMHDIEDNICHLNPSDTHRLDKENMGRGNLTLIQHKNTKSPFWTLFCIGTSIPLRTPALLGIPVGHSKGVSEIVLDITDANGKVIKSYHSKSSHVSFVTLYWGFKLEDAKEKSLDISFVKAMRRIKKRIDKDSDSINFYLPNGYFSDQELLARQYIKIGNSFFAKKNYSSAIENYLLADNTLTEKKGTHASFLYQLGMSYIYTNEMDNYKIGIETLKRALELNPKVDFMAPVGIYLANKNMEKFAEAATWLDYTLNNFNLNESQRKLINDWKKECLDNDKQLKDGKILSNSPKKYIVKNLGAGINSEESDYFPSITADESMLLFTSIRDGSLGGKIDGKKNDEDLWYSIKLEDGQWSKPLNFGKPVNTSNNNGIASFTGDGQYVVCGRCNEPDGFGSCDIYGAKLSGINWSTPINLGGHINTSKWDAQVSISADGKTLVWASNREGGYGEQDLWMSTKQENGVWNKATNLGSVINTFGSEYSPFLHPDGKTLFFGSNGHGPRIGGVDIFKSVRRDDGSWSKPENLGFPINSEKNDMYFVLAPSGITGYFASDRSGGFGGYDIYEVIFPDENRSRLITFVGKVLDDETLQPLEANIKIEDLDSSKTLGEYVSNSVSGKFVVILKPGGNYSLTVSKNGYLFYSENFAIAEDNQFQELKKDILLQPLKEGKKIVLNNIFFETAKSVLTEPSMLEIGKLYELLQDNPRLKVEISGHTDNVGNDAMNQRLSQDRADVVVEQMVKRGIASDRLIAKGYGRMQPIAPNDTPENRQLNRRTEFKILSTDN